MKVKSAPLFLSAGIARVHPLDKTRMVFEHLLPFDLECRCQQVIVDCPGLGEKSDFPDLGIARKILEGALDAFDGNRRIGSALRVHEALQRRPVATVRRAAGETGLSVPTVTRVLERLTELNLLEEISGRQWRRTYAYREYLALLNEGTET